MSPREPFRPDIPPLVWFAVGMWAGAMAAEELVWRLLIGEAPWGAVALTAALVGPGAAGGFLALSRHWQGNPLFRAILPGTLLLIIGALCGSALSVFEGTSLSRNLSIVADTGARTWTGVVEADPAEGRYGPRVRVRITGGPLDGARVRVGWPSDVTVPELGRTVTFAAVLRPLPPDAEWARRMARGGACATGTAWRAVTGPWKRGPTGRLYEWRARMLTSMADIPGPGGALLEGVVLGDRRRLAGTDVEADFTVLGLSHLVAVSGSHLAIACAAVIALGERLRVGRRSVVLASVLAGAAYAVVTGMAYSALRSLVMLAVVGLGTVIGRRGEALPALAVAIVAVLTLEPWAAFDIGFQLSALAVGALLVFGGLVRVWSIWGSGRLLAYASEGLMLTCLAQAVTGPVVSSAFGMFSILAPVANVLVAPLMTLALWVGLAGSVAGSVAPWISAMSSPATAAVLAASAWIADVLAGMPGAAIPVRGGLMGWVLLIMVCTAVWVKWPLPRSVRSGRHLGAAMLAISIIAAAGAPTGNRATVTVLDVGQGDAILVEDRGRTMLVDTGPNPGVIREALARHGIRRIDVLVLTHAHEDHTGGLGGIRGVTRIGWVGVPRTGTEEPDEGGESGGMRGSVAPASQPTSPYRQTNEVVLPEDIAPVRQLRIGDTWTVGRFVVRVIWPGTELEQGIGCNDTSVVMTVSMERFDAVLTGDAEEYAQRGMVQAGVMRDIEVLKVPHHGSSNGLSAEGLAAWRPEVALVSVGEGNDFGHPSPETLEMLSAACVPIARTDIQGDLEVVVSNDGYEVHGRRDGDPIAFRARIDHPGARALLAYGARSDRQLEMCGGRTEYRRPEARLPHLRRGGAPVGARSPPPA